MARPCESRVEETVDSKNPNEIKAESIESIESIVKRELLMETPDLFSELKMVWTLDSLDSAPLSRGRVAPPHQGRGRIAQTPSRRQVSAGRSTSTVGRRQQSPEHRP
jgi:hypothetical protein